MERQLKEFQSLLQEKDEQVAQLMEEGTSQNINKTEPSQLRL
jgi:succinate dehydrogenase flavin-adding protein (antitoxin of CptAB toxin-antitoxin module)